MRWTYLITLQAALYSSVVTATSTRFNLIGRDIHGKHTQEVKLLRPAVHEDQSINDLVQLVPRKNVTLFYGEDGARPDKESTFSVLEVTFKEPTVALEHSAFISSITCHKSGEDKHGHGVHGDETGIDITFNNKAAFQKAKSSWPTNKPFILVTYDEGCSGFEEGARSYHRATGYTVNEAKMMITTRSTEHELQDCMIAGKLSWGNYRPHNNEEDSAQSQDLRRRNSGDNRTPDEIIKQGFDYQKDSKQGYINAADEDKLIAQLLPGLDKEVKEVLMQDGQFSAIDENTGTLNSQGVKVSIITDAAAPPQSVARPKTPKRNLPRSLDIQDKIRRRGLIQKRNFLGKVFKAASKFIKNIVQMPKNIAENVVGFVKKPSVGTFVDILRETPYAQVIKFAGGLIGAKLQASGQATFGLDIPGPSMLRSRREETPWGPGILIFRKEAVSTNKKASGSLTLWCVGCGLSGELTVAGSAAFDVSELKFTEGKVTLKGAMAFQLVAGLEASFNYNERHTMELFSINIGPFQIPKIAEVGFFADLGITTEFNIDAFGQLEAGFRIEWPDVSSTLDFVDGSKSDLSGIKKPIFKPIFDANGEISLSLSIGPALSLSFGIQILSSALSAKVKLVETPSIVGTATISGNTALNPETGKLESSMVTNGCKGVDLGVKVVNDLYVCLTALGQELKTWPIDSRVLYTKNWCLGKKIKKEEEQEEEEATEETGGDDEEATSDETSDESAANKLRRRRFFEHLETRLIPRATIPGQGARNKNTKSSTSAAKDISKDSLNSVINKDHSKAAKADIDTASRISYTGILATTGETKTALLPGVDGNMFCVPHEAIDKNTNVAAFKLYGETIISDILDRILHVYKDTVDKYGVARIRLSPIDRVPKQALMVGLIQKEGALIAVDTLKRFYALAVCEVSAFDGKRINKMYAIDMGRHKIEAGVKILVDKTTNSDVTGGQASKCVVIAFKRTLEPGKIN